MKSDNNLMHGEFRIEPCFTVYFQHCKDCKETRCIVVSECGSELDVTSDHYVGYEGKSICESLKMDMPNVISQYSAFWKPRPGCKKCDCCDN
jgi:hypothetical protein